LKALSVVLLPISAQGLSAVSVAGLPACGGLKSVKRDFGHHAGDMDGIRRLDSQRSPKGGCGLITDFGSRLKSVMMD